MIKARHRTAVVNRGISILVSQSHTSYHIVGGSIDNIDIVLDETNRDMLLSTQTFDEQWCCQHLA